jgi:hypothetical protein
VMEAPVEIEILDGGRLVLDVDNAAIGQEDDRRIVLEPRLGLQDPAIGRAEQGFGAEPASLRNIAGCRARLGGSDLTLARRDGRIGMCFVHGKIRPIPPQGQARCGFCR